MFNHYKKTHLEEFIEQLYIEHHIKDPEDLTVHNLADRLNIHIQTAPTKSRAYESSNGLRCMLLDSRLVPMKQRIDFLHELCHILRHAGNQTVLPKPFVEAQEESAEQFAHYATMPFFMIEGLKIPAKKDDAIHYLSTHFGVPMDMAKKRFEQIMRREFEGELMSGIGTPQFLKRTEKEEAGACSESTRIFAYYDPYSTHDGPDQLIVSLDQETLCNHLEFTIPLDERFQEIEWEVLQEMELEPVTRGDLICFDGELTLQIHQLVRKHGLSKQNFLVQMRVVEQLFEEDRIALRKFY